MKYQVKLYSSALSKYALNCVIWNAAEEGGALRFYDFLGGVQQIGGCAAGRGWGGCSMSGGCAVSLEGVQGVWREKTDIVLKLKRI